MHNMYEKSLSSELKSIKVGKFIPDVFYDVIKNEWGKPDRITIELLADIFYHYRKITYIDQFTGDTIYQNKFSGDMLHLPYSIINERLKASNDSISKSFKKLEELNFVRRYVKDVEISGYMCQNVLFVELTDHFREYFNVDENYEAKDSDKKFVKKITQPIQNSQGTDSEKLNPYIDIRYINKDRSNRSSGSSFENLENNGIIASKSESKIGLDSCSTEEIIAELQKRGIRVEDSKEATQTEEQKLDLKAVNSKESNDLKLKGNASKSPSASKKTRNSLLDFLPLSKEDCDVLRKESGREFSDNAISEILQSVHNKGAEVFFFKKKGFIRYASKVLELEKRNEMLVNNPDFRIRVNMSSEERESEQQEKFLANFEYSTNTSLDSQLRRKIASDLRKDKAYEFLRALRSTKEEKEILIFNLGYGVQLTDDERKTLLKIAQQVYSKYSEGAFETINEISIRISGKKEQLIEDPEQEKEHGLWKKFKEYLVKICGYHEVNNWFGRKRVTPIIDEEKKVISLQTYGSFFRDYINREYLDKLEIVAAELGFKFDSVVYKGGVL